MKVKDIYNLAVEMGKEADFRSPQELEKLLLRRKEKFD